MLVRRGPPQALWERGESYQAARDEGSGMEALV